MATMPIASLCIDAGCVLKGDAGRKWTTRSNIQVVFPDPEFGFPEKAGTKSFPLQRRVATSANCAWRRLRIGELCADAKTARLLSAGLLCEDASNLIHLSACAIDHDHTVHQLEGAEYCHPTKIEIISEIGYGLCRKLGDHTLARRRNRGSLLG